MKGDYARGHSRGDGLDAVDTHGGNCALLSAEVMETLSPFRVRRPMNPILALTFRGPGPM